jgi:hypothetical protein
MANSCPKLDICIFFTLGWLVSKSDLNSIFETVVTLDNFQRRTEKDLAHMAWLMSAGFQSNMLPKATFKLLLN